MRNLERFLRKYPSAHVEAVVSLSHKNADSHINVNLGFGDGDAKSQWIRSLRKLKIIGLVKE